MLGGARVVMPNQPHHIIQRGHNRHGVFTQVVNRVYYLDTLAEWKEKLWCTVYAYCLMTNHVHLVIEPTHKERNYNELFIR